MSTATFPAGTLRACHDCLHGAHKDLGVAYQAIAKLVEQRHLSQERGNDWMDTISAYRQALVLYAGLMRRDCIVSRLTAMIDKLATLREELELLQFDIIGERVGSARECLRDARGPLTLYA